MSSGAAAGMFPPPPLGGSVQLLPQAELLFFLGSGQFLFSCFRFIFKFSGDFFGVILA